METLFSNIVIPVWAIVAYAVFAIAVQALPRPTEGKSAEWYIWLYQFAHMLCLNLALVFDPTKRGTTLGPKTDDAGK